MPFLGDSNSFVHFQKDIHSLDTPPTVCKRGFSLVQLQRQLMAVEEGNQEGEYYDQVSAEREEERGRFW